MDIERIGQFIAQVRKEKGLTQKQLADQIGVSDKTVSKWETGKGMPEISCLTILCNALDISVVEFLNGEYDDKNGDDSNIMKTIDYSQLEIEKKEKKHKFQIGLIIGISLFIILGIFLFQPQQDDQNVIKEKMLEYIDTNFGSRNQYNAEKQNIYIQKVDKYNDEVNAGLMTFNEQGVYYCMDIQNPDLIDEQFTIVYHHGKIEDDYNVRVLGQYNLVERMIKEYELDISNSYEQYLKSYDQLPPYDNVSIGYINKSINKDTTIFRNNMKFTKEIDREIEFGLRYYTTHRIPGEVDYQDKANRLINFMNFIESKGYHINKFDLVIDDTYYHHSYCFENITADMKSQDLAQMMIDAKHGVKNGIIYQYDDSSSLENGAIYQDENTSTFKNKE